MVKKEFSGNDPILFWLAISSSWSCTGFFHVIKNMMFVVILMSLRIQGLT